MASTVYTASEKEVLSKNTKSNEDENEEENEDENVRITCKKSSSLRKMLSLRRQRTPKTKRRINMAFQYNKKMEKSLFRKCLTIVLHIIYGILIIFDLIITNIYSPTHFPLFTTHIKSNSDFLLFVCLFIAYYSIPTLIFMAFCCWISYEVYTDTDSISSSDDIKQCLSEQGPNVLIACGLFIVVMIPLCIFCFSPPLFLYISLWIFILSTSKVQNEDIEWCLDTTCPCINFTVYKISQSPTLGNSLKLVSQHLIAYILYPRKENQCLTEIIKLLTCNPEDKRLTVEYDENTMLFNIYQCKTKDIWLKLCNYQYLLCLMVLYLIIIGIFFLCFVYSEFYKYVLLKYYLGIYAFCVIFCILIIVVGLFEQKSTLNKFRWMLPIIFAEDNTSKITTKWSERKFYSLIVNILERYITKILLSKIISHQWMVDSILSYLDLEINIEALEKVIQECYKLQTGNESEVKMFEMMDQYEKLYAVLEYKPLWYLQYLSNTPLQITND